MWEMIPVRHRVQSMCSSLGRDCDHNSVFRCTGKTVSLFSCGLKAQVVIIFTNNLLSCDYKNTETKVI